jgi:hypothetical protein
MARDPRLLFHAKNLLIRATHGNDAPAIPCNARCTPRTMRPLATTQAAFEAIAATLPLGSVGFENKTDEHGNRREGQKVTKAKGLGPAGIVRLSHERLHIAEGLETALGAMSKGLRPMWATGSTAIMAKFPVLSGIKALTIIADHDANGAGERAAAEVASRWREAGKEARVWRPKSIGDLNDILIGGAK